MKKNLLFSILLTTLLNANSEFDIASNFLKYKDIDKQIISQEVLKKDNQEVAYLYNLYNSGYIIIPLVQTSSPIKSYSFDSNYKNLPDSYKKFLLNQLYLEANNRTLKRVIDDEFSKRWDFLKNYTPSNKKILYSYIPNTNLLTTTWNQNYPYNKYLPKIDNQQTLAGCVQVAMGQIMKYYNYPSKAMGVFNYNGLKANLNKYYNWDIMPSNWSDGLEYQNDELAYLIKDLVVLNKATLGVNETLASPNLQALVENYKYSTTINKIDLQDISQDEFITTIKSQIDLSQPILLSLPGHMVVVDGYRDDDSGDYLHLNMGWDGVDNIYYNMDDNIVVTDGTNFGNTDLSIIYNIKPCGINGADDCFKNLESDDSITNLDISGKFNSDKDIDKYEVFLSGSTTFTGDRGYSNQAFYIEIYDSNNSLLNIVSEKDSTINLNDGLYRLNISLCNSLNYCYANNDSNYDNYTVTINSNTISDDKKTQIIESIKVPPVIDQTLKNKIISQDTKILINGYDDNNEDNVTFEAYSNSNIEVTFNKNILNIHPLTTKGYSPVTVKLSSNGDIVEKTFDVLINDKDVKFGKEFVVKGKFTDNTELNKYNVILDGQCSISGYRGFSSQGFYTSLFDKNDNYLVTSANETFTTQNLTNDFYQIGASLKKETENGYTQYDFDEDYSNYILTINCPEADENIETLANMLNIDITTDENLTQTEVIEDINTTRIFENSWNLAGAINPMSVEDIKCQNTNTPTIWQYKNNSWKLYTTIENNFNFETITNIKMGEGFWVNCN